ncbi:response regulator [Curvibacter sp. APW13]|uniref:PAS domain-containing hybrid sensor histidine kinase/response regulator n=1 Tax=Curvibacter sp. APW13 TaxID=3077236 RepID=UPI0028DDCB77|nr:ATP-binding protein [Curvibacter sp. APW13]MDT8989515.1 response regulator [Curvibacter sp. APW13]
MPPPLRRSPFSLRSVLQRADKSPGFGVQSDFLGAYSPNQMIEDLRQAQAELEIQNQALRYSQQEAEGASERFATLFSNVPLALMVVDEEGLVHSSNAMALRLFQPQEHDRPLTYLLPFVAEGHADEVAVAFINAKNEGSSQVHEVRFLVGSDGVFTGDLHVARLENPGGELAQFICAVVDQGPMLAQREALQESAAILRQKNEQLLLSENRMAAVINSSLDAIICVDEQQRITVFNPAATRLFVCPAAKALGMPLGRFLPSLEARIRSEAIPSQAMLGEFEGLTLGGDTCPVEISVSFERRSRKRPSSTAASPEPWIHERGNRKGSITTIFARDLTARKLAQKQQELLEAQLRESQKMQAMGTMAGGIAHDFNNILGAILGNAELARQDSAPDSPALASLAEIVKAGRRARDLVRQILTFSRNEAPKRSPVRMAEVVHETEHLVRVTLPPHVRLIVDAADTDATVLADATQVEQALLNLCTNAVLAVGSGGGEVHMQLERTSLAAEQAEPLGLEAGEFVRVVVRDTGVGMDTQTLQRIFEPFFTTRQVGKGTGLGLSVVHGVMRSHQGAVEVQSTPGEGSRFSLYFPALAATVTAQAAPENIATPSPGGQGQRVLYVDDDEALVFLVRRVLTRKGFDVTTFTSPQEALQWLKEAPHRIDLLVTDYNMPGYSGVDLLRDVKALRQELPVALASGYVTPEIEQNALAHGAAALIHKPNDVSELCDTVQWLLQPTA